MNAATPQLENPIRGPARKPEWAQMVRRGGDRVAVLFEFLRREISRVEGLTEELACGEDERNWNPRYRVGKKMLFAARILPGALEVLMPLDADDRERLLTSAKLGAPMKQTVRGASAEGEGFLLRLRLASRTAVSQFAKLVMLKNTLQPDPRSR